MISHRPVRTRITLAAVSATALAGMLSGCSAIGEVVAQEAGNAACALVSPVIDQAEQDLAAAIEQIPTDPAAAAGTLTAASDILGTIGSQVTDESVSAMIDAAETAIRDLADYADGLAAGDAADQMDAQRLTEEASASVQELAGIC